MTWWGWVLVASLIAFATKLAGFLLPTSWLTRPSVSRVTSAMTIGLLTGLVCLNTFASGSQLRLDARLVSLLAAAVALMLKAPFIVVVLVGAVAAALVRLAGVA